MSFKAAASLTEQIADHLGADIITGRLAPRQRIQELTVARSLGVSRGSVREALLILEGRHLIEIIPRRGAVVSASSSEQVESLLEITSTLFSMLAAKVAGAWEDASDLDDFDAALDAMARARDEADIGAFAEATSAYFAAAFPLNANCYLRSIVADLLPAHQRLIYQALADDATHMAQDLAELGRALSAIRAHDVDAVERAMADYNRRQRERTLRLARH
jgi:DNA-binding GntR family transcriptional regulator